LDGIRLSQDWGLGPVAGFCEQDFVPNGLFMALYVEPASNIRSILLCPVRLVLWASLWGIRRCVSVDWLPTYKHSVVTQAISAIVPIVPLMHASPNLLSDGR